MSKSILIICLLSSVLAFSCTEQQPAEESQSAMPSTDQVAEKAPQKMLRHVVLFKFKDTSSAESIDSIETAFRALPEKIATIKDFEWGTDVSEENLQQGFTHCFFVSFADKAGRATYLPHPAHQAFVALAGPHIDKVLVVDYFSEK